MNRSAKGFLLEKLLPAVSGIFLAFFLMIYVANALDWDRWVLLGSIGVFVPLSAFACVRLNSKLLAGHFFKLTKSKLRLLVVLIAAVFIVLLVFSNTFPHPGFLTVHTLEICGFYTNPANPTVITQIRDEYGRPIPLSSTKAGQPWNIDGTNLVAQAQGACAHLQKFFKGDVSVYLQTSPDQGAARITWDGNTQFVDLNSADVAITRVHLPGASVGSTSLFRAALASVGKMSRLVSFAIVAILAGYWLARAPRPFFPNGIAPRALVIFGLIDIAALGQLGKSAAMVADDFCFAAASVGRGVLNGALEIYSSVNGRFGPALFDSISGNLFDRSPFHWSVWLTLVIWLLLLVRFFHVFMSYFFAKVDRLAVICLSICTLGVTLFSTPDLLQSLIWHSGRTPLVNPILFFLFSLTLLPSLFATRRRQLRWLGFFLLSFFGAMFHEAFAAGQVAFWFFFTTFFYINRRDFRSTVYRRATLIGIAAGVASIIGLATNVFAPGTAERSVALGSSFALVDFVRGTLVSANWFLIYRSLTGLVLAVFGLAFLIGRPQSSNHPVNQKLVFKIGIWLALTFYAMMLAAFSVGQYGLHGILPERTQIVPMFWSSLFAICFGLTTSMLYPSAKRSRKLSSSHSSFAEVAVFLFLSSAFLYDGIWANTFRPEMERYSVAVRALWNDVDQANQDGLDHVVIKNFPTNPFGLTDPETTEVTFVNSCINQLARLDVEFVD